ncbi:hypothetical protein JOB18_019192 [Solea senegalensis]|uniref:Uncharacterized protein n=1 Tax=Solea senegalensis TaxID=28829 RepID=A0AAV6S3V3_SOLSE|nr:hypothetical protein JOB18_019192 [Solea senegalensis]
MRRQSLNFPGAVVRAAGRESSAAAAAAALKPRTYIYRSPPLSAQNRRETQPGFMRLVSKSPVTEDVLTTASKC